jgi:hypothetical protein
VERIYNSPSSTGKRVYKYIQNPNEIPPFLTKGITYLIPKEPPDSKSPEKNRPITCLPTIYKILTSCIVQEIQWGAKNSYL